MTIKKGNQNQRKQQLQKNSLNTYPHHAMNERDLSLEVKIRLQTTIDHKLRKSQNEQLLKNHDGTMKLLELQEMIFHEITRKKVNTDDERVVMFLETKNMLSQRNDSDHRYLMTMLILDSDVTRKEVQAKNVKRISTISSKFLLIEPVKKFSSRHTLQ